MPTPIRINRTDLERVGACTFDVFDASPALNASGHYIDTTAEELAERSPRELLWLVSRGIVKIGLNQARSLVRQFHGDTLPALRHETENAAGVEELKRIRDGAPKR